MRSTSPHERYQRTYPRSVKFFIVPLIALLIPVPFIIFVPPLQLLPFFSLACIWLGLAGIALEALSGRVRKLWLLPVFALFGLYFVTAALEHSTFSRVVEESARHNASIQLDFDPQKHALIAPNYARELVTDYGLPVVWREDLPRSFRLIDKELCTELRDRLGGGLLEIGVENVSSRVQLGPSDTSERTWRLAATDENTSAMITDYRFCLLVMPEEPDLPAYRIERVVGNSPGQQDLAIKAKYLRLLSPNGAEVATIALSRPQRAPLPLWPDLGAFCARLIPMPVATGAGCIDFHNLGRTDTGASFVPGIAQVLGLEKTGMGGRQAANSDFVHEKFQEAVEALIQQQIDFADAWIEGRPERLQQSSLARPGPARSALALDPEALRSRAERIMTALEETISNKDRDLDRQSVLEGLLAALPRDALDALLPRIATLQAELNYEIRNGYLMRRLNDL